MPNEREMIIEAAINNVTQVCQVFKGTLDEHGALQESLRVLKEKLKTSDSESSPDPVV